MSIHDSDLKSRLVRYLDRRQMPRRLEGKGGAMEDEVRALLGTLSRYAPRGADQLAAWWPGFEVALGEIIVGGIWPTEREIKDAAKVAAGNTPKSSATAPERSEHEIIAARMAAGDSVGENWLYGRAACELISRGLVDERTMTAYRSGAFFARKGFYPEDMARAWEADAKDRHQTAKEAFRDDRMHSGKVTINPNRFGEVA